MLFRRGRREVLYEWKKLVASHFVIFLRLCTLAIIAVKCGVKEHKLSRVIPKILRVVDSRSFRLVDEYDRFGFSGEKCQASCKEEARKIGEIIVYFRKHAIHSIA